MTDTKLDEEIRTAFGWLMKIAPLAEERNGRLVAMGAAPRSHRAKGWMTALAAVVITLLVTSPLLMRSATGPSVTPAQVGSTSTGLSPVSLGVGHLWPAVPMGDSPIDVVRAFAAVVLGWDGAVVTEATSEPGLARFVVEHPYAAEPLLATLEVSRRSWVAEVSPIAADPSDQETVNMPVSFTTGGRIDGIQVDAPMVADSDGAELTVRLVGGEQIVLWVDLANNADEWLRVEVPGVDGPEDVSAILVRYVKNGRVVSAAGAGHFAGA